MTALLIKDWKVFKNQGRYFFTILAIAMAILIVGSEEYAIFATSYTTFLVAYFALGTISYDDYDNGMSFLMALPVTRRIYVSEKYLLAVLLTAGAWIFSIGINCLFFGSGASKEFLWEMLCTEPVFLMTVFIFLSISLPLFLKFGPEKGRMISFGILGAAALTIFILAKMKIGLSEIKALDKNLTGQPLTVWGTSMALSVLIVLISYMVSVKLIEKKEF